MISCPIIHEDSNISWRKQLGKYNGKSVIVIGEGNRWVQAGVVTVTGYIHPELFVIGQYNYRLKGQIKTKEQIIDALRTGYPDYFEFLLFHPELM